jgi:hypothetical protein
MTQMFSENETIKMVCLNIALVGNLLLAAKEGNSMWKEGVRRYFGGVQNFVDVINIVLYIVYYIMRMHFEGTTIPWKNKTDPSFNMDYRLSVTWVMMNTFLLVICMEKLLYYMRLNEGLSMLSFLVQNVF